MTPSGRSNYPAASSSFLAKVGQSRRLLFLLFAAFVYLQLFHGLGRLGLVGPDEPRYAQVAREMAVSGDWVTPRLQGKPWFEKPVLYYWMAGAAFKTLGVSELSARLPSAVAGLLGVLVVLGIGWHWAGWRCGLMAASILAASPLYLSLARAASTDMLLNLGLTLSFASLYLAWFGTADHGTAAPAGSTAWAYGYCGSLAVGVLAKGPVALILAGASLGLFLTATSQWGLLKRVVRPGAVLLGLAVAVPWYLLCYQANGWIFIQEFLLNHNLARFTSDRYEHSQPFWFYIPVVFAGFFPWVFQIAAPVWRGVRVCCGKSAVKQRQPALENPLSGGEKSRSSLELFFWIWALVPFFFFSLSRSKLPGYILPIFPALALLAAREWEQLWNADPGRNRAQGVGSALFWQALALLTLGVAAPWGVDVLNLEVSAFVTPFTVLLCSVGGCAVVLARFRKTKVLPAVYLAGTAAMMVLLTERVVRHLGPLESSRDLAAFVQQKGLGEKVFVYKLSRRVEYGLGFYLNTRTKLIYSEADVEYPAEGGFFLITEPGIDAEAVLPRARMETQAQFMGQKVVRMRVKPR